MRSGRLNTRNQSQNRNYTQKKKMDLHPCAIRNCTTVWSKAVSLYRMPQGEKKRLMWLQICKNYLRDPLPRKTAIYFCQAHFLKSDFQTGTASLRLRNNAVPSIFPDSAAKDKEVTVAVDPKSTRKSPHQNLLLKNNVNTPRNNSATTTPIIVLDDSSDEEEQETSNKRLKTTHSPVDLNKNSKATDHDIILIESDEEDDDFAIAKSPEIITIDLDDEFNGTPDSLGGHKPVVIKKEKPDPVPGGSSHSLAETAVGTAITHKSRYFSFSKMNDNRINYMTGLTRKSFDRLLLYCVNCKLSLKRLDQLLPVPDQLLITLFKYRHNMDCVMLAIMFHLVDKRRDQLVRDIVTHWTKALNTAFKAMDFFKYGAQSAKRYRAVLHIEDFILDEFSIQAANNRSKPIIQKTKCLMKLAVAVDENGAVLGASKLFKNLTPKEIFAYSGLMEKIQPGDQILTTQSLITMAELAKVHQFHVNEMLVDPKETGITKIQFLATKSEIVKNCMQNVKKCKILTQNCEFYRQMDEIMYNCLVLLGNWNNERMMDRVLAQN